MGASSLQQKYQKSVLQRGRTLSKGVPDLFQLGEGGATVTAPSCSPKFATGLFDKALSSQAIFLLIM